MKLYISYIMITDPVNSMQQTWRTFSYTTVIENTASKSYNHSMQINSSEMVHFRNIRMPAGSDV